MRDVVKNYEEYQDISRNFLQAAAENCGLKQKSYQVTGLM